MSGESNRDAAHLTRREGVIGALLAVGVLAMAVLRLLTQPIHVLDVEHTMVATAGREWAHGHLHEIAAYQLDIYQGAFLVDALLSALGFVVLGDHPMAWWWVPLAYIFGTTVVGMLLLRRVSGGRAAVLWAFLLAAAPFVVKDGFLSGTGGHAPGVFYMLLATWLALGRGVIRPLLAGAALGFGIWYVRSAAAVVPAVALACMWQGRKRAVAWFAGGLLLLPALVLVNALVLADAGRAGLGTLLVESVSGMRRDGVDLPALPAKAGESLSVPSATTLFAPVITDWWAPSRGLSWFASCVGVLWVAGWALGLLLAMVRLPRRLRGPTRNLPAVAVGLLPLGCAAAYVFGPFRIEHGNRGWTPLEWAQAPNVTDVRYVVPILLMWTALVSLELAEPRSWRPVHYLEWVAAGLLVLGGSLNAVIGARVDRAPAGSFMATGVVRYGFLYGPHRGPSRESHATCSTGDPISRAAHLRALGAFAQPSPWTVRDDPRAVRRRLLEVKQELGLTNSELAFVAEGVGMALADQLASTAQIDLWELVRWLESSANELDCGLSAPFSLGVATFLQNAFASAWVESDELTPLLCTGAGERARPFCFMAGSLLDLRDDMDASAMVSENPLAGDPVIERALMRGLGVNTGSVRPPGLWPQAENLTHWPVDHREAFLDGLRTGGRRRWRFEATPEFRPDRMP